MYSNLDKSQKHGKGKKTGTKGYILCDSIYKTKHSPKGVFM